MDAMKVGDLVKFKGFDTSVALVLRIKQGPWGTMVKTLWVDNPDTRWNAWNDLEVVSESRNAS